MDFTLTDDQQALAELSARVFSERVPIERVREIEETDERVDRALWGDLAAAELLGVTVPEARGGLGLGCVEAGLVLEQQGRRCAPVPLWPAYVAAHALVVAPDARHAPAWLPDLVVGSQLLTVALSAPGENDPQQPGVVATRAGDTWVLDGIAPAVPAAHLAARVVVPARAADGALGVFLLDSTARGVTLERQVALHHEVQPDVVCEHAAADVLVEPGPAGEALLDALHQRALVSLASLQVGVVAEAVRLAAAYTSEREQFGRPLSTNQGLAMEVADAHIAAEALRVVTLEAAWRIDAGLDATREVLAAKWWAGDGGLRAAHIALHVHGGIGADVDYPIHRCFLWAKQLAAALGGPSATLARLGHVLAEVPV